ncbi:MAG: M28 family peptidase [Flavobacteriales bacterium]|nr:M28 family peptidase [Flavobacteriales bacterium]
MRLNHLTLIIGLISCAAHARGQADSIMHHFAAAIDQRELRMHLEVLASDSFMGRDTGKEGQKMAAAYLRDRFRGFGVPPLSCVGVEKGFYQPYELIESSRGSISLRSARSVLSWPGELLYFSEELESDLVADQLIGMKPGRTVELATNPRAVVVLDARDSDEGLAGMRGARAGLEAVNKAGYQAALVVVREDTKELLSGFVHAGATSMRLLYADEEKDGNGSSMQVCYLTEEGLQRLVGRRGAAKLLKRQHGNALTAAISFKRDRHEARIQAENVLAYIEGSEMKDELIVITAHYDHIGVEDGIVFNGADDDGSGTVALIEIAQAFMLAKAAGHGPKRSVLVMPVSGEERGLLGSRYYSDHPVFPLEQTVANLNIDMIGRVDSAHAASGPYVYIIGSDKLSTELHRENELANGDRLELDYTFNAADDPNRFYYRSDHYNFARKGIPCIFYFSGVHEDYHRPGDDVEKIRFDLLESRARLVFCTAWRLANRVQRIRVDKP